MDTTQRLMADRLDLNVRAKKEKAERERAFAEVRMHEDLTDPAVDLYGEDSWGKFVNPLTEMSAEIPDSYDIDCSGFVMPIESRKLTSGYGYRKRFGRMHYGTDMGLVTGDTIVSAFDGRVRVSSFEPRGYGHYVIVRHPNGLETIYGHMSRRIANEGDIIKAGQPIGLGGNTGRSTGPHLHFECRFMGIAINPADLFDLEQGVPLDDVYHFRKGAIQRAVKSPIYRAGRKAGSRSAAAQRRPKTHRIKRGDTLSAIAKRNSTTVSKIKRLNPGIKEGNLQINRSIRVK
ncbi:M23 family metallopeptidase [Porphyromonas crevioricanis]|nr:M23 family metallopeptidase [Porphyromonas crevioricanis]